MSTAFPSGEVHDLIEQEIECYKAALPHPDPDWPVDVRVLMSQLNQRLFETELRIGELMRQCGLRSHEASTYFANYIGVAPKEYRLFHQTELAKRLIQHEGLMRVPIYQVALAVGYEKHSAFSTMFKKRVGCPPTMFKIRLIKEMLKEKNEASDAPPA